MLWLPALILILVIILGYLMFAPVVLKVDSENGLCSARFHHLASAVLRIRESSLIVDIAVAGWKKEIDLLSARKKSRRKQLKENVESSRPVRKKRKISWRKMWSLLYSFKVNNCEVVADMGDMPLNGMLFPVFYGLSVWSGKSFKISFNNETEIKLEVENTLARMLWAYFRTS